MAASTRRAHAAASSESARASDDPAGGGAGFGRSASTKLPWSPRKSWPGSLAFLVSAWAASMLFGALFYQWGWCSVSPRQMIAPLLLASLAGAAVESLPFTDVDNLLVPAAVGAVLVACKCC